MVALIFVGDRRGGGAGDVLADLGDVLEELWEAAAFAALL
jgi:hypothetical protein